MEDRYITHANHKKKANHLTYYATGETYFRLHQFPKTEAARI